jgi:hypothetical protein
MCSPRRSWSHSARSLTRDFDLGSTRGAGYALFLTPTEDVLSLKQGDSSSVVSMNVVGAYPASHAVGLDQQAAVTAYAFVTKITSS